MNISIPLARSKRLKTDPRSCRNFSCNLLCWNSNPRSQTSSSFIFLFRPTEIRGDIQETVKNCHKVRSSSGLRRFSDDVSPTLPIPSFGKEGSRVGIDSTAAAMTDSCAIKPKREPVPPALKTGYCARKANA